AWDNFDGDVDAVSVGVNGTSTTYDFDKTAGTACPIKNVIVRTWTAGDACGNKASCSQIITTVDTTPPILSGCPQGSNLGCNPAVAIQPTCADVQPNITASDTCTAAPTINCQQADSDPGCIHTRKSTI